MPWTKDSAMRCVTFQLPAICDLLPRAHESGDTFTLRSPQGRRGLTRVCVWHPFHRASQEPTKVATVSHFAAPRDGEVSCSSAYDTTPLRPPGAHNSGNGFHLRSPQGRRGVVLICVWPTPVVPPRNPRKRRHLHTSQPQRTARSHSGLRMTRLRCASQGFAKLANASHFTTPREGDVSC